jgi:hypothetical protein
VLAPGLEHGGAPATSPVTSAITAAAALQVLILSDLLHAATSSFDRCRAVRYRQALQAGPLEQFKKARTVQVGGRGWSHRGVHCAWRAWLPGAVLCCAGALPVQQRQQGWAATLLPLPSHGAGEVGVEAGTACLSRSWSPLTTSTTASTRGPGSSSSSRGSSRGSSRSCSTSRERS